MLRRIEQVCRDAPSLTSLRERVLARVRERIPFEAHVFAVTDPVTGVATAPHADVPMLPWPRLPELIRCRYLTLVNRWDRLLGAPASSLLTATAAPDESLLWRQVLCHLGVADTATVAFGDRYGAWGFLELWRTARPFAGDELALLTALAAPVTEGLRSALSRTFVHPGGDVAPIGPAVIVLGPDLAVRTQTDSAAVALLQLLPPGQPMAPIPAAAYNVGAALIAYEHGIPVGEPWARVHLGSGRWVTLKASRLDTDIAVSIEPATPAERTDIFGRCFGLSGRESQVLGLIAKGLDSKQIAAALVLSEHTVNDHVKAVLAKTHARTRQALLARALGSG